MKDEEKAKEYRKSLKQRLIDEDDFERLEMFDENVEESFLAGLKAGRPQWHKVADGDLPKHNHEVLCLMWSGTKEIGYYENEVWHFENFVADYEDVDYWQEIVPPKEIE